MDGAAANIMEIGDPQELAAEDGVKKLIEAAEGLGVVDNKAATMTIEEMLERAKRKFNQVKLFLKPTLNLFLA